MRKALLTGILTLTLGAGGFAVYPLVSATEPVDTVVTGSVRSTAPIAKKDEKGSAAFRAALGELADGNAIEAFKAAAALPNAVERRTIQWAAIYFNAGKIDYNAAAALAEEAPEFAASSTFQTRLEQSLTRAKLTDAELLELYPAAAPSTMTAQIDLAQALLRAGETERATELAQSLWTENFLTREQEAEVLATLGSLLDKDDHWARAMRLMMHDRAKGSERLLGFFDEAQKSLVVARAAVSRNDADAKARLDAVHPSMQTNPVFIFSRAQRARQFELWESAVEWLNKAPAEVPEAGEWWDEREILARQLLALGDTRLAFEAAAGQTNGPAGPLVQAKFYAGWIALTFLDDGQAAREQFAAMSTHATLPDSISQANYWLARAELRLGNEAAAQAALKLAAEHRTVFYGQLARAELGEPIEVRNLPNAQDITTLFEQKPLVRAVRLLAANGEWRMAVPLLRQLGFGADQPGELLLAAELAREIGAYQLSIAIAAQADQKGHALDPLSFPEGEWADEVKLAADEAAVHAVVRQESMFQVDAVSHAGARGLMQLMPGTAKDVARDLGLDYSPSRLVSDPAYNTLLGSTYLATQLERYDGSLLLAAAAYNAGPGNANKWIKAYGDPRTARVDPVVWVELIPFSETRTYVKRVLGNYLVYRERLGAEPITQQQALRSIR